MVVINDCLVLTDIRRRYNRNRNRNVIFFFSTISDNKNIMTTYFHQIDNDSFETS